jgi:hypothetical protein
MLAEEGAMEKLFAKGANKRKEKVNCGVAKCQKKAFKDLFCAVHFLAVERDGYPSITSIFAHICSRPPQDLKLPGGGEGKSSGPNWWDKSEVTTTWQALKTPEGQDYYFNTGCFERTVKSNVYVSETNETSWEKPQALMTSDELNASGDWRWIPDEHVDILYIYIIYYGLFMNEFTFNYCCYYLCCIILL